VQTLVRAEFESALSDFHALSKELKLALREDGVEIVELAPGTLFHRLGLRAGDRVLQVAGQPVRDHETAAAAYSRLMAADEVEVVVARGAREVRLRFRFAR
jgi:C-terminal processing protease CtpA/Prc